MTNRMILVCLAALVLTSVSVALAETVVDISGQVRVRSEAERKEFHLDAMEREFADMRTRVQVETTIDNNTHAVAQFQDSRRLGGTNDGVQTSGTLNNTQNVDLHQAFIKVDRLWRDGPSLKVGRFEFNLGNQRLFGAVGWSNVSRSWEGTTAWYEFPDAEVTGFLLRGREVHDPAGNPNFDVYGGNVRFESVGLELFAFHERDAAQVPGPCSALTFSSTPCANMQFVNALGRTNIGAFFKQTYAQYDVVGNAVYQAGEQAGVDIAAFLVTLEAGYSFNGRGNARIAGGIDFASGDDDPTDNKINTYNNLYYTGHAFRGYMDYFISSDTAGLIDVMLRGEVSPAPGWVIKADLHHFMTAADYTDFNGDKTTDVGSELDATVSTTRVAGIMLTAGGSAFLATEAFAMMEDPELGLWGYVMMTAEF
jgi:hypothetical protein